MSARVAAERLAHEVSHAAARPRARRTLLLDLDGTLAPIAQTPERARVPRAVLAALERLVNRGWSVVVVSGRPVAQASTMVPVAGVDVYGSHGAEPSGATGVVPPQGVRARLEACAAAAEQFAIQSPGARVEVKPAGVALHDRGVSNEYLGTWRSCVRQVLERCDLTGLEVVRGRRVVEVRARGAHKGVVVDRLIGAGGTGGQDASIVAIGDDRTDEGWPDMRRCLCSSEVPSVDPAAVRPFDTGTRSSGSLRRCWSNLARRVACALGGCRDVPKVLRA